MFLERLLLGDLDLDRLFDFSFLCLSLERDLFRDRDLFRRSLLRDRRELFFRDRERFLDFDFFSREPDFSRFRLDFDSSFDSSFTTVTY